MRRQLVIAVIVLLAVVITAAQCRQPESFKVTTETPRATEALKATESPATMDGAALLQERCTVCHNLKRVESAKKTADEWRATVGRMVSKGAKLNSDEQEALIKYLAATYK
jgi:cytochrome c5